MQKNSQSNYGGNRYRKSARRRRRRRRIIRAWCARILFLAIVGGMIFGLVFLIKTLVTSANISTEEETKHLVEVYAPTEKASVSELPVSTIEKDDIAEEEITESTDTVEAPSEEKAEPRISAYSAGEVYYYDFSLEDKIYIAKVVYKEARGEPFEGQVAVAAVIINRYFSSDPFFHKESIYSVVTQKYQFASIANVTMEDLERCPSCMEAVESACKGWDPTRQKFENGATYFYELEGLSDYQRRIRTGIEELVIGNHHFHVDFNEEEARKN